MEYNIRSLYTPVQPAHINKIDKPFDNRFFCVLESILKSKGSIIIEKDLNGGISSRHLIKLIKFEKSYYEFKLFYGKTPSKIATE